MTKWRTGSWVLILVLALAVPGAWAQQQKDPRLNPPVLPLPPISTGESSSRSAIDDPVPTPQNAVKPDEKPLSGAEDFTLGISSGARSFVSPTIRYTQIADNNQQSATSNHEWRAVGTLAGQLGLQRIWGRSQLGIDYSGGSTLFTTASNYRASFQRLGISQQENWRRVTLLLADSMTYLPESSFGVGGIGGIGSGLPGGLGNNGIGTGLGGNGLGGGFVPGITPNQSIINGIGRRISNTGLGQLQFLLSPRTSLTLNGSFGLLRFLDSGFIDSNSYQFSAGYNYKFNAADTIGVVYSMSMMRFSGFHRSADFHNINLAYGRRLTGRLAMRISGGPQIANFNNPLVGASNRIRWGLNSSLIYNIRNTSLGLVYWHGSTSGSGAVVGADTDQIDGTIQRQITRMWEGGLQFGYSHNRSIQQLNTASSTITVNTWQGGFHLSRPMGRQAKMQFTYNISGQTASNPVGCTGLACGHLPIRHQFGLAFSWGFGPYLID